MRLEGGADAGANHLGTRDCRLYFVALETNEHGNETSICDADVVADGIQLSVKGHVLATIGAPRPILIFWGSCRGAAQLVSRADLGPGPFEAG